MKKRWIAPAAGALVLYCGAVLAAEHEAEGAAMEPATPLELFACSYVEGKGPADLDRVITRWNRWADNQGLDDYTAWTLVPYYSGPEQDFDVLWIGGSETAAALGRAQDTWLRTGSEVQALFNQVVDCNAHVNMAVLQYKAPPERANPANVVVSFSDCDMADGKGFGDVAGPLAEWAAYRADHGSTAGMWVMFPAYGGGDADFDFKFVTAYQNLEDQGVDWDQYAAAGWQKAEELFAGNLRCDESRVYIATNRRMSADHDD
ncbi:MAG: hypothetical protein R3176_10425 [Woeseiaceae bacterium]|nr:hypothetical protein [Woeseiaceae bacterium]